MENNACSSATFFIWGLVGWGNSLHATYICGATIGLHPGLGLGWGEVKRRRSCHLRTCVMLRYGFVLAWVLGGVGWGGVARKRSCDLRNIRDATLLLRDSLGLGWGGVGQKRSCNLHTYVMLCYGYVMAWVLGKVV